MSNFDRFQGPEEKMESRRCIMISKFPCLDCGANCATPYNGYMLNDDLWNLIVPENRGFLCWDCCQFRLGRSFIGYDFTFCMLNYKNPLAKALMSQILGEEAVHTRCIEHRDQIRRSNEEKRRRNEIRLSRSIR